MKFFLPIILLSFFSLSSPVYSDYKNPTSYKDCHVTKIPLWHEISKTREKAYACSKDVWSNVPHSQWRHSRTSCNGTRFVECASLYQQACDQHARVRLIHDACAAKANKYRLFQKEEKKRQEAFERNQRRLAQEREDRKRLARRTQLQNQRDARNNQIRDNNRFMRNAAREALNGTSDAGKQAQRLQKNPKIAKDLLTGNVKQAALSSLGLSKYYAAYQAAHGKLPKLSAHSVSGQLVKYGTRIVDGFHSAAQNDLQNALTNFGVSQAGEVTKKNNSIYNSRNPRPSATQVEEIYSVHENVQTLIEGVIGKEKELPLGTQSIVNIASAVLVYKIMEARIEGEITSLSNALTKYTKSVTDNSLAEPTQQLQLVSNDSQINLKKERLAVMQTVEVERRRIVNIQTEKRRKIASREIVRNRIKNNKEVLLNNSQRGKLINLKRKKIVESKDCMDIRKKSEVIVYNNCSKTIKCYVPGLKLSRYVTNIIKPGEGRGFPRNIFKGCSFIDKWINPDECIKYVTWARKERPDVPLPGYINTCSPSLGRILCRDAVYLSTGYYTSGHPLIGQRFAAIDAKPHGDHPRRPKNCFFFKRNN